MCVSVYAVHVFILYSILLLRATFLFHTAFYNILQHFYVIGLVPHSTAFYFFELFYLLKQDNIYTFNNCE
jgi:hypothetical protein